MIQMHTIRFDCAGSEMETMNTCVATKLGVVGRLRHRKGAVLVWCSVLLLIMIGMIGLVIDGALLMAGHRHNHNAADAAALAAAYAKMRGLTDPQAEAEAVIYVTDPAHNNIANATLPITRIPPSQGAYAGASGYVEAIVTSPIPTYFIHVLPGINAGATVSARAVAGYELVAAGEGVITLDPNQKPGLKVAGGGTLCVNGTVLVNSLGGGVDENGETVEGQQTGIQATNNSTVKATEVLAAGGVNDPNNFINYESGGPNPLDAGTGLLFPDPLVNLPTPTDVKGAGSQGGGVVLAYRGSPQATSGGYALNNPLDASVGGYGPNYIRDAGLPTETMVLHPGIYESIQITGGNVEFVPGIYVLSPQSNTVWALDISGGTVIADGIMFYNTGQDYDPLTGLPDRNDGDLPPPNPAPTEFGGIKINASMGFSPIDTTTYNYGGEDVSAFNGMLFYYRRWNTEQMQIEGNSSEGDLVGTLYAKWANAKITGQGTYDAQFITGSMDIAGTGNVTINFTGNNAGKAPQIFLVE